MNQTDIRNLVLVDLKSSQINKETNTINRVSIMSSEAFDTEGKIFRRFTEDALNDAVTVFDGALARLDHDPNKTDEGESRGVNNSFGVYNNIRREGSLVFGDLSLWDCADARKVMSIAQRTPSAVGNSIHAGGKVYEDEDGVEIVQRLLPRTAFGLKPSIDLVEDPAATISLYQDMRNKSKSKTKENTMEFKDLTQESVRTNRPDLEKIFLNEGKKSRDEEVTKLEQEKKDLSEKLDNAQVKQAKSEKDVLVSKLVAESELPDYAKTDIFLRQLVTVKETKDGDKTISVEDGIKALIQDRLAALEPGGVHDNDEKDVNQNKNKGKDIDDDEFVEVFAASSDF